MTIKTAVNTGYESGLGRAVSQSLFAAGGSVTLAGRNASKLADSAAGTTKGMGIVVPANVTAADEVRQRG